MKSVYQSKIDAWLIAVMTFAMVVSLYTVYKIVATGNSSAWPTLLSSIVLGVCLPLWLLLGTRYTLDTQTLKVMCGPFRWTVPLREVTSIRPTVNPLASPALSLDRLRIEYGNGRAILISPRDKHKFVRDFETYRASSV